jgi:uracil-DNA glycosylase family 4
MKQLIEKIYKCTKCEIAKDTNRKSIGRGAQKSPRVLFIGLNPGNEENKTGKPFCGPSGKLLDKWVEFLGLRENQYAVINLIRCYTPNESALKGYEAENCMPFLKEQLDILNPHIIVPLGSTVTKELLGLQEGITKLEGNVFIRDEDKRLFVPMAHPSYYLRKGQKGWEPKLKTVKMMLTNPTLIANPYIDGVHKVQNIKPELNDVIKVVNEAGKALDKVQGSFDTLTAVGMKTAEQIEEVVEESKKVQEIRPQDYVPLHVHTCYSEKDSCVRIDEIAEAAKNMGFKALATTDHGNAGSWYEFQQQCDKQGIKPLLGIEFYGVFNYNNDDSTRYHVVAFAKDRTGLENLMTLVDISFRKGYYRKPRILFSDLLKYGDGLVVTSACTLGFIPQVYLEEGPSRAMHIAEDMKERFGDDFYIELQPHNFPDQLKVNEWITFIAKKLNIKTIITTDIHYIFEDDLEIQLALKAISFHHLFKDEKGFGISSNYLMTDDELREASKAIGIDPEVIEESFKNTFEIAEKVNARLEKYENALPKFEA